MDINSDHVARGSWTLLEVAVCHMKSIAGIVSIWMQQYNLYIFCQMTQTAARAALGTCSRNSTHTACCKMAPHIIFVWNYYYKLMVSQPHYGSPLWETAVVWSQLYSPLQLMLLLLSCVLKHHIPICLLSFIVIFYSKKKLISTMFLKLCHGGYYLVVSSCQRILEVVFSPLFYTFQTFFFGTYKKEW